PARGARGRPPRAAVQGRAVGRHGAAVDERWPTFSLRTPEALGHVLRSPGQLGVGRAYVSGALDVDDVEAALALLDTWKPPAIETRDKARIAAAAVRAGALRTVPHVPDAELRPRGRRHSVARDRRSVRHHYDVSNAFFQLFLGES